MNTTQLECFLAVADTLSFARASEIMNITQPAVTQQIHALEQELGTRLFNRTTRSVSLTDDGLMFINDARGIVGIATRARQRFRETQEDESTDLLIGLHSPAETLLIADALYRMQQKLPINPIFRIIPFSHIYRQLAENSLNAVISFENEAPMENLIYEEITTTTIVALIDKRSPLYRRKKICMEDLAGERLIMTIPPRCPRQIADIQHELGRNHPAKDIMMVESHEQIPAMVLAGFGIGLIPRLFVQPSARLKAIAIDGMDNLFSYGIYHIWKEDEITRLFCTSLKESFSSD